MPVESGLFVACVVVVFALFIVALAWGERQTRSVEVIKSAPATHPAE